MKYVDWVCKKHAHGDYSLVEVVLVAHSFDFTDVREMKEAIVRPYFTGHQAQAHVWKGLRFVTCTVTAQGQSILEPA